MSMRTRVRELRSPAMAALGGQATGLATLAAGIWDGLGRPWALGFIGAALVALGTAAELKTVRKVPRAG